LGGLVGGVKASAQVLDARAADLPRGGNGLVYLGERLVIEPGVECVLGVVFRRTDALGDVGVIPVRRDMLSQAPTLRLMVRHLNAFVSQAVHGLGMVDLSGRRVLL